METLSDSVQQELDQLTNIQRAAVLMLLLGEQEAANIISYLNPKEVQPLGAAMVSVADLSQEAISAVLDEFIATIKKQTTLGLGVTDYVETVLKRALGEDKAASVLSRILPGSSSKGLDVLNWMDARTIAEMIRGEHPQVVAIILSVLEYAVDHLEVSHVIVCGHYGCGGVQRAMVNERGAMLDHWLQPLTMLYRKHRPLFDALPDEGARLDRLCELNIEMQVRRLAATPIVENAWARGQKLNLHGWIYAIHDGLIRDLGPHLSSASERDALLSIDQRVAEPVESQSARRRQAEDAFAGLDLSDMASPPCCMLPLAYSSSLPKTGGKDE